MLIFQVFEDYYRFPKVYENSRLKVLENKKSDKKIIQKLDLLLCQKDNQRYEKRKKQE